MGTNVILDVLGSIMIGGILLMTLFRMSERATNHTYSQSGDLIVQQNLATLVSILEYDFRKIGYCADWTKISDPTKAIIYADPDKIKFITDVDKDGNIDSIFYYVGPTSELIYTSNPRDRILYRVVNDESPAKVNLGVTQFNLQYFDANKNIIATPVAVPGEIQSLQISLAVEDIEAYNQEYSQAFWRQVRLTARNSKNR